MKVLFAVNNDNISEAIVKKYQKDYREVLSYKNVYYFNAILKELQNDRTYDRIVISEDLEPFANNNYDTIDKFLFEKLEKIREDATGANGKDIEIVIICADRRSKSDEMLNKLFSIKIYNALIGDDRNIDELCRLIAKPRTRNEAKIAYKVEGNRGTNQMDEEIGVSELEVQNILAHYKRLGKNEDKYVDSFNNIVSQYTDAQLRIIIKYLPLHVKAVLEEQSSKYRALSSKSVLRNATQENYTSKNLKTLKQQEELDVKLLNNEKDKITKPIVIPTEMNNKAGVKISQKETNKIETLDDLFEDVETLEEEPKKRRGRPRKKPVEDIQEEKPKRGRGRPKKELIQENNDEDFDIDLFNIDIDNDKSTVEDTDFDLFNMTTKEEEEEQKIENELDVEEEVDLFDLSTEEDDTSEENSVDLFDLEEQDDVDEEITEDIYDYYEEPKEQEEHYIEPTIKNITELSTLLTSEKKIVSFVGTTKNGTSFIVNNLGLRLAEMNISTAILDMTQNKNSYYIFTNNEERLRRIADNCFTNLENGVAEGLKVAKNLTVYTGIPGEIRKNENINNILASIVEKHDIVLIDTDFNTNVEVFDKSQEIYLVQSMDILTIQPLTAFLRTLKTKNILRQDKIKIVINKNQKLRYLTDSILIGGMSSYNDPSMTLMTELFNREVVSYCKIPFEVQNYTKYLDSLVNCELDLRGYTKQFLFALDELAEFVYPLLNKTKYVPKSKQKSKMEFSSETRNTLNKMKKNY